MTLKSSDILVDTAVIYGDYSEQTAAQFFHQAEAHTSAAVGTHYRVLYFHGNVEAAPNQVLRRAIFKVLMNLLSFRLRKWCAVLILSSLP